MLFDRFCKLAESRPHDILQQRIAKGAKIFLFDDSDLARAREDLQEEEFEALREDFFLPFPIVAIEHEGCCIMIEDTIEEQRGIHSDRHFVAIHKMPGMDLILFVDGKFHIDEDSTYDAVDAKANDMRLFAQREGEFLEGEELSQLSRDAKVEIVENCMASVLRAMREFMFMNSPNHFVMEISSTKAPKKTKGAFKRITRSNQRSRFTLVTPKQIRQKVGLGQETPSGGRAKASHMRRRHFREFRSDRYTKMRGKRIVIPAHWVGPSEKIIGNKRYKVRLDV